MTAPKTWVTNELVSASDMNTEVRDTITILAAAKPVVLGLGDPAGAVITTGLKRFFWIPIGLRIGGWTIASIPSGSIVLDLWYLVGLTKPTVANTITGSEKPTLVAAEINQDLTLNTWTTDLAAGGFLGINVDSCSTIKRVDLTLNCSLLALV